MDDTADPLDREKLRTLLDEDGIDHGAYSLEGGHPSEAYVLDERGDRWVVYYSERGLESGLVVFPSEAVACRHLRGLLQRDLTTRT